MSIYTLDQKSNKSDISLTTKKSCFTIKRQMEVFFIMKEYDVSELINTRRYYTCLHYQSDNHLHTHNFYELVYQIRGESVNMVNNQSFTLKPGDVLIMKPGDIHQIVFKEKTQTRDIYILDEQFKKISHQFNYDFIKHLNENGPIIFSLHHTTITALEDFFPVFSLFPERTTALDDIHYSIVSFILGHYINEALTLHQPIPPWMKELIRDLSSDEFISMSVNDIVSTTNYSYGHVAREFKKYSNYTLTQYIMQLKMEKASSLLLDTYDSVEDISYKLGFQSSTGFIKAFSRVYKNTPHKYRQKHAQKHKH